MKFILSFLLLLSFSTTKAQTRMLGGDISLLPTYEKAGTKFIDANGKARPLLKIAKDNKWNAARVRLSFFAFLSFFSASTADCCVAVSSGLRVSTSRSTSFLSPFLRIVIYNIGMGNED